MVETVIGSCEICGSPGRVLAYMGTMPLVYCAKHRKYGQEVIHTFLEDIFNYKKSKLFDTAKQEFFFNGDKILDEKNEETLGSWVRKEIFRKHLEEIGSAYIKLNTFEIRPIKEGEEGTTQENQGT